LAAAVLVIGCSAQSSSGSFPGEAGVDARLEASSPADAGGDRDASGGPDGDDGGDDLPECDDGKTCALPFTCDPTDLLCEPTCGAMQACAAGTFCRLTTGSLGGNCIGPDYQCLGHIPSPPAPTDSAFSIIDTFLDVSSGLPTPAVGLTVKACAKTDAPCANPVGLATTDQSGAAGLTVPAGTDGFDGYLDVTGPSGDGGTILETLVFSSQPVVAGGYGPTTNVQTAAAFQQSVAALGTVDMTRAQLLVVDEACRSTPAFGASLAVSSADGSTKMGYVGVSGIAAGASTFPVADEASAYALNVTGATTTLTTTYGGQTVNQFDVVLRPDVLCVVLLDATPAPVD
jgi:hypothetical protein